MFVLATLAALVFGAGAPVLTLDEALQQARSKNLDIKAAEAKLAQVREVSGKVWAGYLPQVGAGASYTYNNAEATLKLPVAYYVRDTTVPQGPPSGPDTGKQTTYLAAIPAKVIEATIQAHDQIGAQATLNQAVLAPALYPAIKSAGFAVQAAELNIDAARREVLFGVAQLYYGLVSAREAVSVQEKLLEANALHEKDAQVRVEAGAMPKVVLLRAKIDRVRSEQDVARAKNTYSSLRSSLSTLLDRTEDFDVATPGEPKAPTINEEKLTETLHRRPDVRAAEAGAEAADWGSLTPKMKYLPNIGVTGRLQWSNVGGFAGQNTTWAIGVGINWSLFDGGSREAEIREAAAKLEEARITERSTLLKANDEIRRARLDLESALANRTKALEQLELATENARIVQVNFASGTGTYIEVSDAASALAGAELAKLAETLNAQLAVLRLAKAAGAFDPS